MELKCGVSIYVSLRTVTYNCTNMELKFVIGPGLIVSAMVL